MDLMVGLFLVGVLLIAVLLIVILTYTHRTGTSLDRVDYQRRWLTIHNSVKKDQPATYQVAIFEADKLLDKALKEARFAGQTMGERMKSAQASWKNANDVWSAHKLRNRLAHESDVVLRYGETERALQAFKQGLRDMGAI